MKHYSQAEWLAYIKNELQEEERWQYDDHLYSCDHCLNTYMACVQEHADIFPEPASLQSKPRAEANQDNKVSFQRKHLFIPYAVAASITLVLMGTGVFESLFSYPVTDSPISYSEKAVQTVTGWLDQFKK